MKEKLTELFGNMLEHGTNEDLKVLEHILEGLQSKQRTYINSLLHMEHSLKEDTLEIKIPLNSLVNNPLNILHGGITATLIDTAMGAIVHHVLPEGKAAVTTQLNIHYIAPGIGDSITCSARIDHHGTKTMLVSADVFRTDGQKIAQASGSFFIIERR